MTWVLLLLLASLASIALVMLLTVWVMKRATRSMVGDKHHQMEEIFDTGEIPRAWHRRSAATLERLQGNPRRVDRIAMEQARAKAGYLRRLDGFIRYARQSGIIRDEETRRALLDRLTAVRTAWADRSPDAFP
jgi:hypothetical protein